MARILLIQGHPDQQSAHSCHALAAACADETRIGGVGQLDPAAVRKWLDKVRALGRAAH